MVIFHGELLVITRWYNNWRLTITNIDGLVKPILYYTWTIYNNLLNNPPNNNSNWEIYLEISPTILYYTWLTILYYTWRSPQQQQHFGSPLFFRQGSISNDAMRGSTMATAAFKRCCPKRLSYSGKGAGMTFHESMCDKMLLRCYNML